MLKRAHLILIIVSSFMAQALKAQDTPKIDSLFLRLQKHTDTTIIFEHETNWTSLRNLSIISKKSDTLNAYTYRNLAVEHHTLGIIRGVRAEMRRTDRYKILRTRPDINEFFHYYPLRKKDITEFWSKLNGLKPWLFKDDSVDGEGCPGLDTMIYDGGSVVIYLITKDEIRKLKFYAPDYFYKRCPLRKDLRAVLELTSIFRNYIL